MTSSIENPIRKRLHCQKFSYDTALYNFKEIIEGTLGCNLETIHHQLGSFDLFERSNDQSTLAHRVFYANFNRDLQNVYVKFISDVIRPIVGEPFYYQKIPTFRIGLPGNRFVGEFHSDASYNHQPYEVNFNLGLANYTGDAALKVKSDTSDDFYLLECPYGQIFSFDHIDCLHGSDPNNTALTMASFDFRVAIKGQYYHSDCSSVNTNSKISVGEYFSDKAIE